MASGLLKDYVGRGLLAARPATPTPATSVGSYYFATDTALLYCWDGSTWKTIGSGGGGAPTVGSHRYWRIISRGQWNASSYSGYSGIEFRGVAGGANLATGGTLVTSLPTQASGGTLFGGNGTSDFIQFDTGTGAGQWVGYDFGIGVTVSIQEISIYPLYADITRTPNSFEVQFSDNGLQWTTATEQYCSKNTYTYNVKQIFTVPTTR